MILTPALGSQRTPGALVPIAACFFTLEADGPTPGWLEGGDLGGQCREDDIWDFGYKVSPAGALSHSASGRLWSGSFTVTVQRSAKRAKSSLCLHR